MNSCRGGLMRRLNLIWMASLFAVAAAISACTGTAKSDATSKDAAPAKVVDEFREVTIPADTNFTLVLEDAVASAASKVAEPVRVHLIRPVPGDGVVGRPAGPELLAA